MRTLAILTLLTATVAAPNPSNSVADPATSTIKPICEENTIRLADHAQQPLGVHPLGDEPPARHLLGVVRTVDGCSKPVVVHEMVGPKRR